MRQSNLAVLVEGYMDVIGVWRAGIRNAVATCGTALTSKQIGVVRRHCDTVVVNFDSDKAGQAAAERSVELLLREGMNVRVLELPGGMDPDEFCKARGGEAYHEQLERAPRYFYWLLDRSRTQFDLTMAEGRTAAFEWLLRSVALLPDEIQRATTVTELAEHIGLQQGVALNRLRLATNQRARAREARTLQVEGLSHGERLLIVLLANDEQARAELLEKSHEIATRGLPSHRVFAAMLAVQRSGDPFQYAAVEGRLESADRERLARLVFDKDRPAPALEEGREALAALRRQVTEQRYHDVRRRIAMAETLGRCRGTCRLAGTEDEAGAPIGLSWPTALLILSGPRFQELVVPTACWMPILRSSRSSRCLSPSEGAWRWALRVISKARPKSLSLCS